jgi:exonuclease III
MKTVSLEINLMINLVFGICYSTSMVTEQEVLRIFAWNMKGFSGSKQYALELLDKSDLCVFTEHHLYPCELHKIENVHGDYQAYSKSCSLLDNSLINTSPGYGGVNVMWRTNIGSVITRCTDLGNDRIVVIKIQNSSCKIVFVITVYLPQKNANFDECVDLLDHVIERCMTEGEVAILKLAILTDGY